MKKSCASEPIIVGEPNEAGLPLWVDDARGKSAMETLIELQEMDRVIWGKLNRSPARDALLEAAKKWKEELKAKRESETI